uniref:ATP-dependent helicase n=1 Tax=Lachnoclostridium phocaeense TaxID=1871021 RepID=UPI0026DD7E6E|nr:ATP-dependent helicase [Lachnoclostridium phocaeense]
MINYQKELNAHQLEAVTTTEGPLLILAGAGSGKTRTLIYRVAYLIEQGVVPEKILLLTFTNKAANEMKERAAIMLDSRCERITACTYHSFCARTLRKYANLIDMPRNYTIIDEADNTSIISMAMAERGYNRLKDFPKPGEVNKMISKAINRHLPIQLVTHGNGEKYVPYTKHIVELRKAADEYKRINGLMNYDDILLNMLKILRDHPRIAKEISALYEHIMVDEYQDSNYLQEQIVFLLRRENRNLAVVGDDAQSIYGFRGSDVRNIIEFPSRMPGCHTVFLTRNYRSNQEILDLSNDMMAKHATEGISKNMIGTHNTNLKPTLVVTKNQSEEATYVFEKIKEDIAKGIPLSDICVLARSATQTYLLEKLLETGKIPFTKYGGLKFFELNHIKDVIAFLRCMINEHDELAWYRILQIFEGIGKKYARDIAGDCKVNGMKALIDLKYFKRKFSKDLAILYQYMITARDQILKEKITTICDFYYKTQKSNIANMRTDENNRETLFQTLDHCKNVDFKILKEMAAGYLDEKEFLDNLSLDPGIEKNKDGDTVILSTIHSAKGLEFRNVYILDCVDEICPITGRSDIGTKEDNEELRCFYVAVTRAKEQLCLIAPKAVSKFGKPLEGRLSHFLTDITELFAGSMLA